MKKYAVPFATMFIANSEAVSLLALIIIVVMFIADIINAKEAVGH